MHETVQSLLNNSQENEVIEFKEAKANYDFNKLGKYFSALSNEANLKSQSCAWLVFGVNNQKQIVGTGFRNSPAKLQSLKKEIADKTTGGITFVDIIEDITPQGRVLLFQIPPAPRGIPTAWQNHWYGRDGESLGALNIEELERLRGQVTKVDWSAITIPKAGLDDLDPEAIVFARTQFMAKNPKLADEVPLWDDATFLNKAKITRQGQITTTAILLLGRPEASHWINPAAPTLTWILKDSQGVERDYEHFGCPLLLNVEALYKKVRNLKYRYLKEGTLFPEEVDQYDPFIIREALHNAIAHQDYELQGRVNVVEFEDGKLCFSNLGRFIPGNVEAVIQANAPAELYRNPFLVTAMVNLKMIDTIGSGIRKMFLIQKARYFPLPEYEITNDRVLVTVTGRVLDPAYAKKLAAHPELSLEDILLLDRLQKGKTLTDEQVRHLKKLRLIEGRKPNFHISANVASHSDEQAQYILKRGFDDQFYKKLILEYLEQFQQAKRGAISQLMIDKLPDVLTREQKETKVKNLLQALKREGLIKVEGKIWRMSKEAQ